MKLLNNKINDLLLTKSIRDIFIYLNTSCNMRCKYCNSSFLNSYINNKVLSFTTFMNKIEWILKKDLNIPLTFYGGEPLIFKELLLKCISYLISRGVHASNISVFTNGTLIDEKFAFFVKESKINLIVSLDGTAEINDLNRIFKVGGNSSYEVVLNNLNKYGLKDKVVINMVITPSNVSSFVNNCLHFFSIGFKRLNWDIDCQSYWSDEDIKVLEKSLDSFLSKFLFIKKRFKIFEVSNLKEKNNLDNRVSVTLMNDGNYYLCDMLSLCKGSDIKNDFKIYKDFIKRLQIQPNPNEFFCGFGFFILMKSSFKNINDLFKTLIRYKKVREVFDKKINLLQSI